MAEFALMMAISVAVSYAAGQLGGSGDIDSPVKDQKPTPLVERGSPIPLMIGRELMAPVICWAGDRSKTKEEVGGKGLFGGGGQEVVVWHERGFHALCVGPGAKLWKIRDNGKVIFKGPIDDVSHPSGTTVNCGKHGKFVIYWGEGWQPENDELGEADQLNVTTRWPYICYIYWINKRLGPSPTWGRLTYDMEVRPHDTKLSASGSWMNATRTLQDEAVDILQTVDTDTSDPPPATPATIRIDQGNKKSYKPGQYVQILGNTIPDGDYLIQSVAKENGKVILTMADTMTGLTDSTGTIQAYKDNADDGANPAHVIYQSMFSRHPHGMGRDPSRYDMASLENVGVQAEAEGLRVTLHANNFKTAASALADVMQDVGIFLSLDPVTGLQTFDLIRETDDVAVLTDAVLVGKPEEVERIHVETKPASRKMFEFKDRNRDYSPVPIVFDNDGAASEDQVYGTQKITMPTVRDYTTGLTVAQRRDQESYSAATRIRVEANREARMLRPGRLFTIPSISTALLLLETNRKDSLSGEVELTAVKNFYGISASGTTIEDGGGILPDPPDSDEDLANSPFEIPHPLNATGAVRFGEARIRTDSSVGHAVINLSDDDTTFTEVGIELGLHTGGELATAIDSDGPGIVDEFATIDALGPDITGALDLSASGNKTAWQRGRQVAVVSDGTNTEIMYVRYLEALGGDQYKLREVIRARLGTQAHAFAVGTPVILFDEDDLTQFSDLLLQPETTIYTKSLPVGNAALGLDDITSTDVDLYGYGVRPMPILSLRAGDEDGAQSKSYYFPNDVTIRWGYHPAPGIVNDGAGYVPAGNIVPTRLPSDGTVIIRILDPEDSDAVVRETELPLDTTSELVYTQAQYKADFGLSAGYSPGSGTLNLRSAAASPTPTQVTASIPSCGGSSSSGNWTAFTPATMDSSTSTVSTGSVLVSNLGARGAVFVGPAFNSAPDGDYEATLEITAVTGGGASIQPICAVLCRFDSSHDLLETITMTEDDPNPTTGATTKTWSVTGATFSGWDAGDKLGINFGFKDNGSGSTTVEFDLDNGNSKLESSSGALSGGVDFKVEALVSKGAQVGEATEITVENLGGTTT